MDTEDIINGYFDAWNRRDPDALLSLMHKGAAHYDAFWRETCSGRDLTPYFELAFREHASCWYLRWSVPMATDDGIICRYHSYAKPERIAGDELFAGANVFTIRDGLIVTVSNHYCDPDPLALAEVARLASRRHGLPSYAKEGLSAVRSMHLRNRLTTVVDHDALYQDPPLTVADLARNVGCSVDELYKLAYDEYGRSFNEFLDTDNTVRADDLWRAVSGQNH